ncbi:hypothetical protein Droror1_Dr00021492 [Drosera rotundifolia]
MPKLQTRFFYHILCEPLSILPLLLYLLSSLSPLCVSAQRYVLNPHRRSSDQTKQAAANSIIKFTSPIRDHFHFLVIMAMTMAAPATTRMLLSSPNNAAVASPYDLSLKGSRRVSPFAVVLGGRGGGGRRAGGLKVTMRAATAKQSYICRDCGYIYKDRTPFEKVPDNYFCPVCGAPKRRFRPYEQAAAKNTNDTDVRKARKAQLKRDEAIGQALPIAILVGIALLGGLYFYLNSIY